MIINGREFPGQPLRQGAYIRLGVVSLWDEVQYVTTNPIADLLVPGYFNPLFQIVDPPARIEVASFTDGEWRYAKLAVVENTFDQTNPGVGGTVSVRRLDEDAEHIPETVPGLQAVHKGAGRYEVQDGDGEVIQSGLTKDRANAIVLEGRVAA